MKASLGTKMNYKDSNNHSLINARMFVFLYLNYKTINLCSDLYLTICHLSHLVQGNDYRDFLVSKLHSIMVLRL